MAAAKTAKKKSSSKGVASKKAVRLAGILVSAVVFCMFLPGVWYGFINMDDLALIANHRIVKTGDFGDLGRIFSHLLYTPHYKPLVYSSWILERMLFGIDPHVIHFNNALLHAVNAGLVFELSRHIVPKMWPKVKPILPVAAFCALIWGMHPFRIESVTWAVERKDVLFSLFYLLACLTYIKHLHSGRENRYLVGTVVLYLCACLSKSMGITFLAAAVLIEVLFVGREVISRRGLISKAPLLIAALICLYLQGFIFPPDIDMSQSRVVNAAQENVYIPESMGSAPATVQFAAISNFRLIGFAAHFLLPVKVAIVYPRELWLDSMGSLIYVLLAVPLFFLALLYLKKDLRKTVGFGLFWFAMTISPILVSDGTGTNFLSDRYTYIPSLGLVWMVVPFVVTTLPQKIGSKMTLGYIVVAAIAVLLSISTVLNIRHWRTSLTLWENVIAKYPVNWYGYYNRAKLISDENPTGAIQDLNKAIDYVPNQAMMYFTRGTLHMGQSQTQEAIADFTLAIQYDPKDIQSWINRGSCYRNLKQYQNALNDFTTAISLGGKYMEKALNNRGLTLTDMGLTDQAIADFDQIIQSNPSYVNAYLNRANLFVRSEIGRFGDAIQDYTIYIDASPNAHDAIFRRGFAKFQQGQHNSAIVDFDAAIAINPNIGFYYFGRSQPLKEVGRKGDALADLQRAQQLGVRVDPAMIAELQ